MLLMRARTRSSLPHLNRLRSRQDVGLGGVATFGTVLAALLVSTLARAEPALEVRVAEQPSLDVVVTVKGSRAPTFQVFRLPGQDAFAVELPGTDLASARQDLGRAGVLLEDSAVEASGRSAPRVIVRFYGDVDYDAKSDGTTLRVTFTALGDKGALRQAWQARRSAVDAQSSAKKDLAEAAKKLEEQRQAYLAMVRELEARQQKEQAALAELEERTKQARAGLTNLEHRKVDEEKRLEQLAKQRADAEAGVSRFHEQAKKAEEDKRAAEQQVARVRQELKSAQEELAKAKDQRALEEARSQLAAVKKELDGVVANRAAEQARLAEVRTALEQSKRELSAVREEQKREQDGLLAAKRRADDERARTAQSEKESKRAEQLLASLQQQLSFEQQRLDGMRLEVRQAAEQLSAVEQRSQKEEARLASLSRAVAERQQALAQLEAREQQAQQRLAALSQRAAEPAPRQPPPAPARAQPPVRAAKQQRSQGGRIEMASAEPSAVYGFGGRSIDLAPSGRPNRYELSDGFDDDEGRSGLLSHITVQRGNGAASRVGVRVDGGARYAVERTSAREVVLTLFGTRAANLDVRRILDARDLGTTVLRVLPRVHEGGDSRVELTIELRESVPVRVAQDDAMLWVHVGS